MVNKAKRNQQNTRLPAIMKTGALLATMNIYSESIILPIRFVSGIIVEISGSNERRETISTLQLTYVSNGVKQVYLDSCVALQVIPPEFPQIRSCPPSYITNIANGESAINQCKNTDLIQPGTEKCSFHPRELPPKAPIQLP